MTDCLGWSRQCDSYRGRLAAGWCHGQLRRVTKDGRVMIGIESQCVTRIMHHARRTAKMNSANRAHSIRYVMHCCWSLRTSLAPLYN